METDRAESSRSEIYPHVVRSRCPRDQVEIPELLTVSVVTVAQCQSQPHTLGMETVSFRLMAPLLVCVKDPASVSAAHSAGQVLGTGNWPVSTISCTGTFPWGHYSGECVGDHSWLVSSSISPRDEPLVRHFRASSL